MNFIQHCFICRPSDSTVLEEDEIETRTVATSTRSHPPGRALLTANRYGKSYIASFISTGQNSVRSNYLALFSISGGGGISSHSQAVICGYREVLFITYTRNIEG
jgi:hypothetical protein